MRASDRSVRRAVSEAKRQFSTGRHRVYRPWVPEPGMWAPVGLGEGPGWGARDGPVLRLAGLEPPRLVIPVLGTLPWPRWSPLGPGAADLGRGTDLLLTDNERTVSDRPRGRHRGPQPQPWWRSPSPTTADPFHLRAL